MIGKSLGNDKSVTFRIFEKCRWSGKRERERKKISENEPLQAIHSQDIATESQNDSKDIDDSNNGDINFTVTNTGIIRDNILGDDDESDEGHMNNIHDPSDEKEVVTRGSETTNANDGDELR
jgi:hypothetical protein